MSAFDQQESAPQSNQAAVQCANVGLTLRGQTVLGGVTATFPLAGISALIGANGAGKSLLLKTLHGLHVPSQGKVRWSDALGGGRRSLMRQRPQFLRRSVQDNLVFALRMAGWKPKAAGARALQTLDWLQLTDHAAAFAPTLSPGLQARLAMARALAVEPAVLLLDEPTASLDPAATLAFEALIAFAADQGTKVIMVSHSLAQVRRLANHVLLLDQGKVAENAEGKQFFAQPRSQAAKATLHAAGFYVAAAP